MVRLYNILFLALKQVYVSAHHIAIPKIQSSNIASAMLYCDDVDRGFMYQDKMYGQILDSYAHLFLKNLNISSSIGPPGSGIKNKNFYTHLYVPPFLYSLYFLAVTLVDILTLGKARQRDRFLKNQYRKFIKDNNCKILVGIQPAGALIEACAVEKISVYDIQHGDIAPGIPYYEIVARRYKNLNFQVWDNVTSIMLQSHFGIDKSRINICGHPWIKHFNNCVSSRDNFYLFQLKKASNLYMGGQRTRVLITLQYGLDDMYPQYFDNEFLPRVLIDVIKNSENVAWSLRLHPVMSKNKMNSDFLIDIISNKNITLHHSHEIALPAVMHSTDFHITWHSSSVIEAINFGIPSMVLCNQSYIYGEEELYLEDARIKPYEQYADTDLVFWPRETYSQMFSDIISFINKTKGKK